VFRIWPLFLLLTVLGAPFALTACSSTAKPIGSTVKGTRVAVMEETKGATPDKDLQDTKPQLLPVFENAAWPQAGYDAVHVMPNAALADHPHEIWRADIGNGSDSDFKLLARPVVSHGLIYTMDSRGLISAFETKNGHEVWEFNTTPEDQEEDTMGGGLGVDGDTVYATTGFGEVIALSADNGKVKWRHSLMKPVRAAPTIADGRVYGVTIDNELTALDAGTGDMLWRHNGIAESATLMGASNPAVVGDSVVIAYSSGEIYNLRAENGRVSWNYALSTATQVGALPAIADIRGLPVIDRDRVIAIGHSGRIASIDHRTGDRDWETDIGGINTPIADGDTVFILSNDNQLVALTRESGRIIWVHELQKRADPKEKDSDKLSWTGPILAANRLWLTNSLSQLVSFATDDGNQVDVIDIGDPSYITPIVADRTIYVVTNKGELVALK